MDTWNKCTLLKPRVLITMNGCSYHGPGFGSYCGGHQITAESSHGNSLTKHDSNKPFYNYRRNTFTLSVDKTHKHKLRTSDYNILAQVLTRIISYFIWIINLVLQTYTCTRSFDMQMEAWICTS